MHVLVVEDDGMIGRSVLSDLLEDGWAAEWVTDGEQAMLYASAQDYDIMLLDLGLPRLDGLQVIKRLREQGRKTPILILTARDSVEDRISGLDLGADDYLIKPFALGELKARMRALLRRRANDPELVLASSRAGLNTVSRELTTDSASAVLSNREYALMRELLKRPGAILSRESLEQAVYGWDNELESNALEVIIHGLRKKFGQEVIRNVRGAGWLTPK